MRNYQHVLTMFVMIIVSVISDGSSSCQNGSKLTQYANTICQIDYTQCSNNTLTIQDCVGYKCKLEIDGNCYYYSYQYYPNSRCMSDCCGYTLSTTYDYSAQLEQCLNISAYSNNGNNNSSAPSNNIALILGCALGTAFFIIVIICICFRQRIKQMFMSQRNNESRSSHNIVSIQGQNRLSFDQINSTQIKFVFENSANQLDYDKELECTICLSQSNNARTHCSHWFHFECLNAWAKKSFHCPNCMSQDINPITVFCNICRKSYAEIKICKLTEARQVQNSLNSFQCNECKNQKRQI